MKICLKPVLATKGCWCGELSTGLTWSYSLVLVETETEHNAERTEDTVNYDNKYRQFLFCDISQKQESRATEAKRKLMEF